MITTWKQTPDQVRAQQIALLDALNAWTRALRRDECGDWRINGKHGHVYTWGDPEQNAWWVFVGCRSVRAWNFAKKRLAFCQCTQDGDDEGAFKLIGLPTADQAEVIRDLVGIRKRRDVTEASVAHLRPYSFTR